MVRRRSAITTILEWVKWNQVELAIHMPNQLYQLMRMLNSIIDAI